MGLLLFTDVETHDNRSKAMEKEPAHVEGQPRIASLAYLLCDEGTGTVIGNFYSMVRPDGWTMTAGAYAVNGLDMDTLNRRGVPIYGVIATVADVLALGEKEPLTIVAHGLQFDFKSLRGELRRAELPDFYVTTRRFCTMTTSTSQVGLKQVDKEGKQTNRPKWPSLQETFQHYINKPVTGHHNAFQDAFACKAIYFEKRKRGEDMTPKETEGYSVTEPGAPTAQSAGAADSSAAVTADSGGPTRDGSPEPEKRHSPAAASPSVPLSPPSSDEDLI